MGAEDAEAEQVTFSRVATEEQKTAASQLTRKVQTYINRRKAIQDANWAKYNLSAGSTTAYEVGLLFGNTAEEVVAKASDIASSVATRHGTRSRK